MKLDDYLSFITETAYLAGRLTLGYFQTGIRPDFKSDETPVTVADRLSEELIRRRIEDRYPMHAIVGEEGGVTEREGAAFRWYVDPIDGTKAFIHGVPLYAVLIGLEIDGQVAVGAAYFPALDEMIAAADGLGCWWNGRRAHVSTVNDLSRSVVAYTSTTTFAQYGHAAAWERLQKATWFQAGWSDAYAYLLAASGRVEIALDPVMNAWDSGPFPPILREAGGYFGDWRGNVTIHSPTALATTQTLLPEVLRLLDES